MSLLIEKSEMFDPLEDKEEIRKRQKEENLLVQKHKREHGYIFPNLFERRATRAHLDNDDGVRRCLACFWEVCIRFYNNKNVIICLIVT